MPEIPKPPEEELALEQQMLQESSIRFEQSMAELTQNIPEIAARPEIAEAGKNLIAEFGIKPSLFDDEGRSLVFAGIASRWAGVEDEKDHKAYKEKLFITDTMALLAHKHSDMFHDASVMIEAEKGYDVQAEQAVYEKYTDKQLSKEVSDIIHNGFLDAAKTKLGITPDNEDPYEIRVLSIADQTQLHGLDVAVPDYSLPYDDPELATQQNLSSDVRAWKMGLQVRAGQFAKELGFDGSLAPAWVTDLNGTRTLCISMALAEKLRDPTVIQNTDWYTDEYLKGDLTALSHEYTHTQGGISVDNELSFGINAEEVRAEHFSGDNHGYQDVKAFFQYYRIITGHSLVEEMESHVKGGTTVEIFGAVANHVGLSNMLEVMMATPKAYIENQGNPFSREAYNHLGGFDGVLKRLYDAQVGTDTETLDKRLDEYANFLLERERENPGSLQMFRNYRTTSGHEFMTEKLVERVKQLQKSSDKAA